jgi:adenylate kinase
MLMRFVILGPPGGGKGTYASRIAPKLGIAHIATGDILRKSVAEKTPEGIKAENYMSKGLPVPNEIMTDIIIDHISRPENKDGFILDTPYNEGQAMEIDKVVKIEAAINVIVPENIIIQRLSTRRICSKCGGIYNIRTLKPKVEGICDKCGGKLYQRKDDLPEAIKERLRAYEKRSGPLVKYYKKRGVLINVECNDIDIPPKIMVDKIMKALKENGLIE